MTPEQKIKRDILLAAAKQEPAINDLDLEKTLTAENIDDTFYDLQNSYDLVGEQAEEFRSSGEDTGIDCQFSRHYESKAVATKLTDGTWVGWTYWYGGGKHGEPEAVDWMDEAYELDVTEEEKLVVVRSFAKCPPIVQGT